MKRNSRLMVSMALWVLEMELGLKKRVENWNAMVDDEVKMQVKCLLMDEMQSTIRQSGVTWVETDDRVGLMTHLGRRMRCRSLAPGGNVLVRFIQFHRRSDSFRNYAQARGLSRFLLCSAGKLVG